MTRRRTPRGEPGAEDGRRRPRWREFREAYPRIVAGMALFMGLLVLVDLWLAYKWRRYAQEVRRLRGAMTEMERRRTDMILASSENRVELMVELARLEAQGDRALNLAVSVDEGAMHLQREGAQLREMRVKVGPQATVGEPPDTVTLAVPRGRRAVVRILSGADSYEVPAWVYAHRGLPVPSERRVKGALGSLALLLTGGAVIYSQPKVAPLDDPQYVMPGSVRAEAEDLEAVLENVKPGMPVYFH